ncbi:MAG: hypothetical protein JNJ99_13700 [Crocinitomicaceae bacterium]|nr:hypothetical protein [Crocinitomicaceae bacterium]
MNLLLKRTGIYRILTLSLILTLIFILISPATFETVFVLFLETLVICAVVFVMSFFGKDFLDIFMQVLVSIFIIPIMLFFVACGFFLFLLIYTGGGPESETALSNELISYCWQLMENPGMAANNILDYFGKDFYYITGGILLYHIISILILKLNPKTSGDYWFSYKKQFMLQCLALLIAALLLSVPMSIAVAFFDSNPWFTFISVIGLRVIVELWKLYMEKPKSVDKKF